MWRFVTVLFASSLPFILATSQGVNTVCDASANMGCSIWEDGNRLKCIDPDKGHMPWVMAPDVSPFFSVRTGDGVLSADPTTYAPDSFVTVYIRALKFGWKYRGLLIHARDNSGNDVGSWNFPAEDHALFWSPPTCPKAAMHVSAAIKPYGVQLSFSTPTVNTGPITFKTLIKRGPANHGYFHRPNDLVLSEGAALQHFPTWVQADPGESCPDACRKDPLLVNDYSKMNVGIDATTFKGEISPYHACPSPVLSTCSTRVGIHFSSGGLCYHKGTNCATWRTETVPIEEPKYNLCPCQDATAPTPATLAPTSSPTLSPTPPTPPTPAPISKNIWVGPTVSAASGRIVDASIKFFLAFTGFLLSNRPMNVYSLVVVLMFIGQANAHNWLHTPGRASFQASTIAPCQGRKSSDLHAQVSRDQFFTIKWATGHERDTYWVVLAGNNAQWLAHSDFETMVDDYIANAPENAALTSDLQRYHGFYHENSADYDNGANDIGKMFQRKVPSNDANFLDHDEATTTDLYQYKQSFMSNDKRVSYLSAKYPWIESAFRYEHLWHLPNDYDAIKLQIPGRSGPGHYIVHWRWSGYYDCIDVDLRSTTVANIYGVKGANYIYNQIDHCQYIEPKEIMTPCMETSYSVEACINALPGWLTNNRLGINVLPLNTPNSVYPGFQDELQVPWDMHSPYASCSSSWNELSGTVTESEIDWAPILANKITTQTGTACIKKVAPDFETDFKRALAKCIGEGCDFVSWKSGSAQPMASGKQTFRTCSSGQLETDSETSEWNTISASSLQTFANQGGTRTTINFVPNSRNQDISVPAQTLTETGKSYALRDGRTFGYNCRNLVECDWCCRTEYRDCVSDCCNPTWQNTYVRGINEPCPDEDLEKYWEISVANGIYLVSSYHDSGYSTDPTVDVGGCNVESTRLLSQEDGSPPNGATINVMIEVTDETLSLNGENGCWYVNWLSFEKVRDPGNFDEILIPSSDNPWWMLDVAQSEPIGLVRISNFDFWNSGQDSNNCASWWLFRGSKCYENRPLGWFNGTEEGAIIGVSNSPCTDAQGCPIGTAENICGRVQYAGDRNPWYIDCKGKIGRYVWVQLPGAARILAVDVRVFRSKPATMEDTMVCYGVEARVNTATQPEFVITDDPEDPIFYATCYSREKEITWLGITQDAPNPPRWRFNNHCLNCTAYHANKQTKADPLQLPQSWTLADGECMNCELETPPVPVSAQNWAYTYNGSCNDENEDYSGRDLASCPSGFDCIKQLFANGRQPSDSWAGQFVPLEECKILASRDSECSTMIFQTPDWGNSIDIELCYCHKNHACCGRCTPNTWDTTTQVYNLVSNADSKPDPTCARGIQSEDAQMCCPSHCVDSNGKKICGLEWECFINVVGGGACCLESIKHTCALGAAPCSLA